MRPAVSLAGEDGEGRRERGLIMLLSIPAARAHVVPYVTGLALDRTPQIHCAAHGMAAWRRRHLRLELAQRFPGHPVLGDALVVASDSDAGTSSGR